MKFCLWDTKNITTEFLPFGTFDPYSNDEFDEYLGKLYAFSLCDALVEDFCAKFMGIWIKAW